MGNELCEPISEDPFISKGSADTALSSLKASLSSHNNHLWTLSTEGGENTCQKVQDRTIVKIVSWDTNDSFLWSIEINV